MPTTPNSDFPDSQKHNFFVVGTRVQIARIKFLIIFHYYKMRAELIFQALKNRFWVA